MSRQLSVEYRDRFAVDIVYHVVRSCYRSLATARITTYVPILLQESSRDQLRMPQRTQAAS